VANSSLAILFPVSADGNEGAAEQNVEYVATWGKRVTFCHDLVVPLHEETGQTNSFILRNRSTKIHAPIVKP
jgi:hypothetical protein